jgi:hypothetical protein
VFANITIVSIVAICPLAINDTLFHNLISFSVAIGFDVRPQCFNEASTVEPDKKFVAGSPSRDSTRIHAKSHDAIPTGPPSFVCAFPTPHNYNGSGRS